MSTEKPSSSDRSIKRSFWLTNLSLRNRTTILIFTLVMPFVGIELYLTLPKDSYPEIKLNQIYVGTPYPGNSPVDIENGITRPLEKEINTIAEVEEITSVSVPDYSTIIVEFPPSLDTEDALQKVKDAVDRAESDLPSDLDNDPNVFDFDFASLPIVNINLSGNYDISTLKDYAEILKDELENITEVAKVEIRGVEDQEVEVLLDPYKMDARKVSFGDIERAITAENINMSGGNILDGGIRRDLRVIGEIDDPSLLEGIIIKNEKKKMVYLRDVAEVRFGYRDDRETYARLDRASVVSVDVVKRSGENLLRATDKIYDILEEKRDIFPNDLELTISNDQSSLTRDMVSSLENNIIFGVILVVLVLQFFLGTRNALFVGIAIPLSMFISFLILFSMDATINMMVLFSLIMALGMLVDNGIVVVENVYRLIEKGYSRWEATKEGVGQVAYPIISSTMTTLAAFLPLLFWEGIVGQFMRFLPITLIITLSSSLFVALVINPVLMSHLMRIQSDATKVSRRDFAQYWDISCCRGYIFVVSAHIFKQCLFLHRGCMVGEYLYCDAFVEAFSFALFTQNRAFLFSRIVFFSEKRSAIPLFFLDHRHVIVVDTSHGGFFSQGDIFSY